jgi:hypothetical protein
MYLRGHLLMASVGGRLLCIGCLVIRTSLCARIVALNVITPLEIPNKALTLKRNFIAHRK